jgi:hypothetical protein
MKKTILLRVSALLMASMLLLCACVKKAPTLTYKDGAYQSESNDVAFRKASMNYRAQSIIRQNVIYNLSRSTKQDPTPLYAIEGLSESDWLTDESFTLYHNSSITLPTLTQMNPDTLYMRLSGDPTGSMMGYLGEDQKAKIDDLVDILTNGTSHPGTKIALAPTSCYELLFESKDYPGFFFVLEYWTYDEDVTHIDEAGEIPMKKGIVYDVVTDRFFVMGEILEGYLNGAE